MPPRTVERLAAGNVDDLAARILLSEFVAYGERGIYMASRASSGQYYPHVLLTALRLPFEMLRAMPMAIMNDQMDVPP